MKSFKLKFFKDCKDLADVKTTYKNLAKQFHPDRGGDLETMKAINLEYEIAAKIIMKKSGFTSQDFESDLLDLVAYREAVAAVSNLENIVIEIVGKWVWITGETKQHKDVLKNAGYFFAHKKCAWYFRTAENKTGFNKKGQSLDSIKSKYGCVNVPLKGNYLAK